MTLVLTDTLYQIADMGGLAPGRLVQADVGGHSYILISADSGYGNVDGFVLAELTANGAISVVDTYGSSFDQIEGYTYLPQGMDVLETSDATYVFSQGVTHWTGRTTLGRAVSSFELESDGSLDLLTHFERQDAYSAGVSQNGTDPSVVTVRGNTYLIQSASYADALYSFRIRDNGTLAAKDSIDTPSRFNQFFDTISLGKVGYIVGTGPYRTAPLEVWSVNGKGQLERVFGLDPSEPLIYNKIISDIKLETIGSKTFAFVAETTSGGLLVYELSKSGELTLVGYERANYSVDGWGYAYSLETFEVDGQTYLVAGGNGTSIAVFAVSENGALTEVDEWTLPSSSLRAVNELTVADIDGQDFIIASAPTENEVNVLRFDEDNLPIEGGGGRNRLKGTEGDDRMFGFGKGDTLRGLDGDDLLEGGAGGDTLKGGSGNDDLYGDEGDDTLLGADGDDFIFGGAGNDLIKSGTGTDYVNGGAGADKIKASDGNDRLFGGAGNDRLFGEAGVDWLYDGAGRDKLSGGDGRDVFFLTDDGKRDVITDFENGYDLIDLTDEGPDLSFPFLTVEKSGDDILITYSDDRLLLKPASGSLSVSDIGMDDFVFA